MSEQSFDAFTRNTAEGVSRRGTLATLGGAALAAAALRNPLTAEAKQSCGKKVKKAKKQAKKQAKQQCQKQVDECNASAQTYCTQTGAGPVCVANLGNCCALMANCNIGAGVTCMTQFM